MYRSTHAILLALILGAGCASIQAYQPLRIDVPGVEQSSIFAAVHTTVAAQGWMVEAAYPSFGILEALAPIEEVAGLETRERWRFMASDNLVKIERILEVRFDASGMWESDGGSVCDTYVYTREQEQMRAIQERLSLQVASLSSATIYH